MKLDSGDVKRLHNYSSQCSHELLAPSRDKKLSNIYEIEHHNAADILQQFYLSIYLFIYQRCFS